MCHFANHENCYPHDQSHYQNEGKNDCHDHKLSALNVPSISKGCCFLCFTFGLRSGGMLSSQLCLRISILFRLIGFVSGHCCLYFHGLLIFGKHFTCRFNLLLLFHFFLRPCIVCSLYHRQNRRCTTLLVCCFGLGLMTCSSLVFDERVVIVNSGRVLHF